jgi:transposase
MACMPRAYSMDLRERLVAAWREEHPSQEALAARFRVSAGTVSNWLRRVEATGGVAPKPPGGGHPPAIDAAGADLLTRWIAERNDRTLEELGALYQTRRSVRPSRSALSRTLIRLGLGRKKKR